MCKMFDSVQTQFDIIGLENLVIEKIYVGVKFIEQVWKDVDGVLTCDPNIYTNAKPVPYLTFEEAAKLAYFGEQIRISKKNKKESYQEELEEHIISLIASLFGGIVKGSRRDRLLSKFVENECEKIDRLMELYMSSAAGVFKIIRPAIGEAVREMPLAELMTKYRKVSSIEKASKGWQDEYEVSSKQFHFLPDPQTIFFICLRVGNRVSPIVNLYLLENPH
ncbi:uncharacterized protein LOC109712820 [Ananas comosus]|uniref:Uncharacterized protein LOC109712820 n=1 Tax=Ananas comosus TaxID=4615 RepID=A0A6P5F7L6_ANACO|nr:uncharacterized protein LOC109712820 [Ananas comosus]